MGVVRLEEQMHELIKNNLKNLKFRVDYKDVKGFVDKAVYNLLFNEKIIKEVKK